MEIASYPHNFNDMAQPVAPGRRVPGPLHDTFTATGAPPETPVSQSLGVQEQGAVIYGNISLDLHFRRSESLAVDYISQDPDGVRQIHQELARRFEAGLSLDFSFLARFEGAADKLKNLDASVFSEWAGAAADLMSIKQEDFEEFVTATDELFNEIEKTLGMSPDGLDYAADFFTAQVKDFIGDVRERMEYFNSHPLGEGEDKGLGMLDILKAAKEALPDEFEKYLEELISKLTEDLSRSAGEIFESLKTLKEVYEEFLRKAREGGDGFDKDRAG